MEATIKKIRSELRMAMNGMVSSSMRAKGLDYRINFGVDIPRLRDIAAKYVPDVLLAENLWKSDARESKILGTMLYPVNDFMEEAAQKWALEIPNQEIREQLCMNLLQKLDFADKLVWDWIFSDDENLRTTGFWLFARMVVSRHPKIETMDMVAVCDCAISDLTSDSMFVRQSATGALKFAGRGKVCVARHVLDRLSALQNSEEPDEKEIFDLLTFEFGY